MLREGLEEHGLVDKLVQELSELRPDDEGKRSP
jgi:hypothetical protein